MQQGQGTAPVVTTDLRLAEEASAILAAAGLRAQVCPRAAELDLTRPGPILVDATQLSAIAGPVGRTGGLFVVTREAISDQTWQDAVRLGAARVARLPMDTESLLEHLLDVSDEPTRAPIIAVAGGRGGGGATTLAAALARTAADHGQLPVLIDLDPFGGGLDLVLGHDPDDGARWPDLAASRGRLQPGFVSTALALVDGIRLLTWQRDGQVPRAPSGPAVRAVLAAAGRDADLVIVDLPRTVNESVHAALDLARVTVLVVPLEVRAAAAAAQWASALRPICGDLRLVTRGPAPTGLPAVAVADSIDLPLVGHLRPEPDLAVALDRGLSPPTRRRGPLAGLCRELIASLVIEPVDSTAMSGPGQLT